MHLIFSASSELRASIDHGDDDGDVDDDDVSDHQMVLLQVSREIND